MGKRVKSLENIRFSETAKKIIELLKANGKEYCGEKIRLYKNQHQHEYSISLDFTSTGLHIPETEINYYDADTDEYLELCHSWDWIDGKF